MYVSSIINRKVRSLLITTKDSCPSSFSDGSQTCQENLSKELYSQIVQQIGRLYSLFQELVIAKPPPTCLYCIQAIMG